MLESAATADFSTCVDENEFVRELHAFLMRRRWASVPQNSDVRHGNTRYVAGSPDIVAWAPGGIAFAIECKMDEAFQTKECGLSKSQIDFRKVMIEREFGSLYRVVCPSNAVHAVKNMELLSLRGRGRMR